MVLHLIFFFLIKTVWLFRAFSRVTCILGLVFYKKLFGNVEDSIYHRVKRRLLKGRAWTKARETLHQSTF